MIYSKPKLIPFNVRDSAGLCTDGSAANSGLGTFRTCADGIVALWDNGCSPFGNQDRLGWLACLPGEGLTARICGPGSTAESNCNTGNGVSL